MASRQSSPTVSHPRTLIVVVHTPQNLTENLDAYADEFVHLVDSNDIQYDAIMKIPLRSIDGAYFFTKGKLQDLIATCNEQQYEQVIISEILSVQQERNISKMLNCQVMDRTGLILSIFEQRATSAEGKLQVELAVLQYKKSRLAGRGISLSQQGGRIGTRGPGETQKERELQHIDHLMVRYRRELERLQQVRATQRKQRIKTRVPLICLVGYTNAGKSSLLNALTHSAIIAENQLFSTLDTTTRELYVEGKKIGLLSDTVGFIQNLPHTLIAAFKSTLHELAYAHLIVHVIDISNPRWRTQRDVVEQILSELEVDKPVLYVFNKVDLLDPVEQRQLITELPLKYPAVFSSTRTPHGLDALSSWLAAWHRAEFGAQKSE